MQLHPRSTFTALLFLFLAAITCPGGAQQLAAPQVFAPGVISGPANDGAPSFSPDGKTLLFTRSTSHWSVIVESHLAGGKWSAPVLATFSGEWPDSSPAFSPDGKYVVFVSIRRADNGSVSHLWRVDRTAGGWSTPSELPAAANAFPQIFRPGVAADGSVYFTANANGKNLSLFVSRFANGVFEKPEALPFSDGSVKDVDPEIAADGSFLVFASMRPIPGNDSHEHLFMVRKKDGAWGAVEPLRYDGDVSKFEGDDDDPRLGPDGQTLYFASDRAAETHFPRAHEKALADTQRMDDWDNGNTNVWMVPLK